MIFDHEFIQGCRFGLNICVLKCGYASFLYFKCVLNTYLKIKKHFYEQCLFNFSLNIYPSKIMSVNKYIKTNYYTLKDYKFSLHNQDPHRGYRY